ncbi:hypothetical protein ACH4KN_31060 [Streptomyces sp. NPDC017546]|uniref:hypothetical protein n=1 Tax=unclassified Streptomyces TaxID=2593676 RepID=UPI00235E8BDF|nr:hypothetical protein [Streptomyces sp. MMBL 11-1]
MDSDSTGEAAELPVRPLSVPARVGALNVVLTGGAARDRHRPAAGLQALVDAA